MTKEERRAILLVAIAVVLAAFYPAPTGAEEPPTPTLTPTLVGVAVTSTPAPAQAITGTAVLSPTVMPTFTPTVALPSPTPTPTLPLTLPGTARLTVMVDEVVLSVGGQGRSEVWVLVQDVQSVVEGLELHLSFDPRVVQVVDSDPAIVGVQVEVAPLFGDSQQVRANRADNSRGEILLILTAGGGPGLSRTGTWRKVAVVTWTARREGKSQVIVNRETHFIGKTRPIAPDAVRSGLVLARAPGRIAGRVYLQGRSDQRGVRVSASLVPTRVDKVETDATGAFEIVTSHGEGFYTLRASAPGYLSAVSERPVKVILGAVIHVGEVTLPGGDVNDDGRVDIRDLSYVAWHFDEYDVQADVNGDGRVDILDLSLTAGNFGRDGPISWGVSR